MVETRLAGGDRPHGITLRRKSSHAGLENPRTPAPPVHSPLPVRRARPQLCFGHVTSEGVFFPCVRQGSNPRPGGFRCRTPTSRASARSQTGAHRLDPLPHNLVAPLVVSSICLTGSEDQKSNSNPVLWTLP